MKSVEETVAFILEYFDPLPTVQVAIRNAHGCVLREDVVALRDHPAFPTATMDGFAVRSADFMGSNESKVHLSVVGTVSAGRYPDERLEDGQAVQIMTGALIPESADAVVPVENTNWYQDADADRSRVSITGEVEAGDNIRPPGRDFRMGDIILGKGRVLKARDIAMVAMLGISQVVVSQRPKIGILTSGDELLQPGDEWQPGKIYDSNSLLLELLTAESNAQPVNLGIAQDNRESVERKLHAAKEQNIDLIVTSAGVSVSDRDFIRIVLEEQGTIHQWRVNLRPGKPVLFAEIDNMIVLGLPGNPVSTYVGFRRFVLPVIRRLLGEDVSHRQRLVAKLGEKVSSDGRETYVRGVLTPGKGGLIASLGDHQDSGNLKGLVNSDVLIKIPAGIQSLDAGSEVEIELL